MDSKIAALIVCQTRAQELSIALGHGIASQVVRGFASILSVMPDFGIVETTRWAIEYANYGFSLERRPLWLTDAILKKAGLKTQCEPE